MRVFNGDTSLSIPVLGPDVASSYQLQQIPTANDLLYTVEGIASGEVVLSLILKNGGTETWPIADMPPVLYVEGLQPSTAARNESLLLTYTDNGVSCSDQVRLTVIQIDLDVDSDNTNGISAPERSDGEDEFEDFSGTPPKPGKYIAANWDNDDDPEPYFDAAIVHERIWDAGDGFNWDDVAGSDDDQNASENDFIPLVLEIPTPIDLSQAMVRFTYSSSAPGNASSSDAPPYNAPNERLFTAAPGSLRIWKTAGTAARDGSTIGQGGDFVGNYQTKGGQEYTPAQLGITELARTVTLYMEGIAATPGLGQGRILVEVDPDGPGPTGFICNDAVRFTVMDVAFNPINNSNTTGFDSSITPPGLMVPLPVGGANSCSVQVGGGGTVRFRSIAPTVATVPEGTHTSDFTLAVTSAAAGGTIIEAYADTFDALVIAQLRAHVLPNKQINIKFHHVSDNAGHTTALGLALAQSTLARLNAIWTPQSNITFIAATPLFEPDQQFAFDLTPWVAFSDTPSPPNDWRTDWQWVTSNEDGAVIWDIFYVWDYVLNDNPTPQQDLLGGTLVGLTMIDMAQPRPLEDTYSHEAGHHFAFDSVHFSHDFPGGAPGDPNADVWLDENLMGDSLTWRYLTIRQGKIANDAVSP